MMTKIPLLSVENYFIKIILLRVNVGHEKPIVNLLTSILDNERERDKNIIEYKFYKILGFYDIMIILKCKEFSHDLLKSGTFDNVINANEILCFPLFSKQAHSKNMFDFPQSGIFISLLKLRKEPLNEFGKDLFEAVALYMNRQQNIMALGGLGWNELLTIYPHNFEKDQLDDIFNKFLVNTAALGLKEKKGGKRNPLVHKTYSFMAIDYKAINELSQTFPAVFDITQKGVCPRLYVSAAAGNLDIVYKRLKKHFKRPTHFEYEDPQVMAGIYDFSIPFKSGQWGNFFEKLMSFRQANADLILDTRIELTASIINIGSFDFSRKKEPIKNEFPKLKLLKDDTQQILERSGMFHVISTIYCLNNLFQDSLLQDGFLDLYIPARKLINEVVSKDSRETYLSEIQIIKELLFELQWAIRERAMGAYLFTEDDEHSFSPIKGGLQKILWALMAIPSSILNELIIDRQPPWRGFVSIGSKAEPLHFMENLHIPFDHAFHPEKYWWCIIHEIGHLLAMLRKVIDRNSLIYTQAIVSIRKKGKKVDESSFRNLADNCFADTFDFIVGFLGNRSFYFNVCWKFIINMLRDLDHLKARKNFMRHMVRHFFGWIFEGKYLTKRIKLEPDIEKEASEFIKKLYKVPNMKDKLKEFGPIKQEFIYELVVESEPYFIFMDHFNELLSPAIVLGEKLKKEYTSDNFKKLIYRLEHKGDIINYEDIKYPHLIPLKLMENYYRRKNDEKISLRTKIMTILSLFWYSHSKVLPKIYTEYNRMKELKLD